MTNRFPAREPAMTLPEAAMLPALPPPGPGRLVMPLNAAHFAPIATEPPASARRGSPAGRAILHARGVHLPGVAKLTNQ